MSRRVVGALVVVLVAGAAGGVLFVGGLGLGESPSAPADGSPTDSEVTTTADATTGETASGGGGTDGTGAGTDRTTATATETADPSGYDFTIEQVEKCGTTCRDVTARLANAGATERTDVRVTTRVYADEGLLWTGNETVGALAPGEAHTSTKRVDVGLSGGMKIQNNDGYVTIVTVVRSDEGTTRFSERRKVA